MQHLKQHLLTPWRLLGLALLAAVLSGCATAPAQKPEDALRARAQAYWDAVRIGDDVTAYSFEEGSLKPGATLQNYLRGRTRFMYSQLDIVSVQMKGENEAELLLNVSYTIPSIGFNKPISGESKDHWVRIDGQWYHRLQNALLDSMRKGADKTKGATEKALEAPVEGEQK